MWLPPAGCAVQDERLGRKSCQIYLCESKEDPTKVCEKLKEAYAVNKEDEKAREGNPFLALASQPDSVEVRERLLPVCCLDILQQRRAQMPH